MKTKFIPFGFIVFFSIVLGAFFYLMPTLWAFLFCFICLFLVFRHLKTSHTPKAVYILIISAILIRIILSIMNDVSSHSLNVSDLIPDASNYTSSGVYIAEILTDKEISRLPRVLDMWSVFQGTLPQPDLYQVTGMAYLQAIIFSAFGYSALGIKIFNSTLGVLVGILAYCFLRRRIGERNSIIALFLILFYPSLVIWSATGLKDSLVIFISFLLLIALGKMINSEVKSKDIAIIIPILGLLMMVIYTLRPHLLYLYSTVIVFSFFTAIFLRLSKSKRAIIFLGILFCIFLLNHNGLLSKGINKFFSKTINTQRGYWFGGGNTAYKIYPDRFYPSGSVSSMLQQQPLTKSEAIMTCIKASVYFMFTPLPMHLNLSKFMVLVYPQSLFTLILLPFMLIGAIRALRLHPLPFTPLLIFMIGYIIVSSLTLGNIGTAFRHKDSIMPIYLMFSAMGISLFFGKDEIIGRKDD